MPNRPFRFLHASDFRLDAVPRGLTEVPDHLRDTLLDAPFTAARRVFNTALAERVAFVVLAGNILRPDLTGPRGTYFLSEQFQRLAEAGIGVYWAGGESDPPEEWPVAFVLPENVRVFPKDRVTDFLHQLDGLPLARIAGVSHGARALHPAEFSPDPVGLFSIGVACGEMESAALQAPGIHYWALGGRAEQVTLFNTPKIAHYPGAPQACSPVESGAHGCTIVHVDDQGRARMSFIAANAMEWLNETLLIDSSTRREDLEAMCAQRIRNLTRGSKTDLLVTWKIGGKGPLKDELRRGKLRGELLEWLRIEHGLSSPIVWTVGVELETRNALPASLYEQETILGDFLRALRDLELDPQQPLNLESLLADGQAAGPLSQIVANVDGAARKRVLHETAMLAIELLGGDTAVQS